MAQSACEFGRHRLRDSDQSSVSGGLVSERQPARGLPHAAERATGEDHDPDAVNFRSAVWHARLTFGALACLLTTVFLYSSMVPWRFAEPDYKLRLEQMIASSPWELGRSFDWSINILSLIPVGISWSIASKIGTISGKRKSAGTWNPLNGCLGIAIGSEFVQFWIPDRVPSLRDCVALSIGAILGCGIWQIIGCEMNRCLWESAHCSRNWRHRCVQIVPRIALGIAVGLVSIALQLWNTPDQWFALYRNRGGTANAWWAFETSAIGLILATSLLAAALTLVALQAVSTFSHRFVGRNRRRFASRIGDDSRPSVVGIITNDLAIPRQNEAA